MEIEIPELFMELLLTQAARQEVPVEEIVERAVRNYMEGDEDNAGGRKEGHHGQG